MKKLKLSREEIWQARTMMFDVKSWGSSKTKKSDLKCKECGVEYSSLITRGDEPNKAIALVTIHGKPNRHMCNKCAQRYIDELGAIDINKKAKESEVNREELIKEITEVKSNFFNHWTKEKDFSTKELEEKLVELKKEKEEYEIEQKRLDDIRSSGGMELSTKEAQLVVWEEHEDWETIESSIYDTSRWSELWEGVFKYIPTGRFYSLNWSVGATESQDERAFEYTDPDPIEVVAKKIVKVVYVNKK